MEGGAIIAAFATGAVTSAAGAGAAVVTVGADTGVAAAPRTLLAWAEALARSSATM